MLDFIEGIARLYNIYILSYFFIFKLLQVILNNNNRYLKMSSNLSSLNSSTRNNCCLKICCTLMSEFTPHHSQRGTGLCTLVLQRRIDLVFVFNLSATYIISYLIVIFRPLIEKDNSDNWRGEYLRYFCQI